MDEDDLILFIRKINEKRMEIAKLKAELEEECRKVASDLEMPFTTVSELKSQLEQQLLEEIINGKDF